MTARDFTFWFQGFFEISNREFELLTQYQVQIIERHLAMVFVHEPKTTNRFCIWLKSVLPYIVHHNGCIREEDIQKIQQMLNEEFEHVIDPSMGDAEQQALLNNLHKPANTDFDDKKVVARC